MPKEHAGFEICRVGVEFGVTQHPGARHVDLVELYFARDVRREVVVVVVDIHEPAHLKLLEIVEAGNGLRFGFGLDQSRQQQ